MAAFVCSNIGNGVDGSDGGGGGGVSGVSSGGDGGGAATAAAVAGAVLMIPILHCLFTVFLRIGHRPLKQTQRCTHNISL